VPTGKFGIQRAFPVLYGVEEPPVLKRSHHHFLKPLFIPGINGVNQLRDLHVALGGQYSVHRGLAHQGEGPNTKWEHSRKGFKSFSTFCAYGVCVAFVPKYLLSTHTKSRENPFNYLYKFILSIG
jgi:hypothetical protein